MSSRTGAGGRDMLQVAAMLVGVVFLLVGVLGFIPGITTGDLAAAGHTSHAKLLGIFQVSALHNAVHLLFGVAGLLMGRSRSGAKSYLVGGGVIYLVLFVLGLVMVGKETAINFVPVNVADNLLHLVLGIGMIGAGLVLGKNTIASRA
ncbi:MAG: DUF4383 domain-containing protein [Mycobacteriales bacterium]